MSAFLSTYTWHKPSKCVITGILLFSLIFSITLSFVGIYWLLSGNCFFLISRLFFI
jgi:hypothetical protein